MYTIILLDYFGKLKNYFKVARCVQMYALA
jgi:hypothetical protein